MVLRAASCPRRLLLAIALLRPPAAAACAHGWFAGSGRRRGPGSGTIPPIRKQRSWQSLMGGHSRPLLEISEISPSLQLIEKRMCWHGHAGGGLHTDPKEGVSFN